MPQYDLQGLFTYLKNRPKQKLETFLIGILNKPLGQMILKDLNIGKLSRNSATLSDAEFMLIAKAIKNQKFIVTGKMPWDNAQVTLGGIKTEEINPHTMESKKISGIYVTGELLDVDAMCGGYNLQWAWSSGYVAGKSAAGC